MHSLAPEPSTWLLAGQGVHRTELFEFENFPDSHGLHEGAPDSSLNFPASQISQTEAPWDRWKVPGRHGVQPMVPLPAKVPFLHTEQEDALDSEAMVPA